MALLKGQLFAGALFAPLLLGGGSELINAGAGTNRIISAAHPRYWAWVKDKVVFADTYEAIKAAVQQADPGQSPVIEVANQVLTLPPKPANANEMAGYIAKATKLADKERKAMQQEHERDEIGLIVAILTAVRTGIVPSSATVSA